MPDLPSPGHLLRTDQHPWFYLADPAGLRSAITEVGSGDRFPGLASLVVSYALHDAPAVQVGWLLRPQDPDLSPDADDDLTRTDLARRLVFGVFSALERQDADRGEILRRINATPPQWTAAVLRIDAQDHQAWTATAADDRLTYAHLGDQTVFVQTSAWDGSTALRRSLVRPQLPAA